MLNQVFSQGLPRGRARRRWELHRPSFDLILLQSTQPQRWLGCRVGQSHIRWTAVWPGNEYPDARLGRRTPIRAYRGHHGRQRRRGPGSSDSSALEKGPHVHRVCDPAGRAHGRLKYDLWRVRPNANIPRKCWGWPRQMLATRRGRTQAISLLKWIDMFSVRCTNAAWICRRKLDYIWEGNS